MTHDYPADIPKPKPILILDMIACLQTTLTHAVLLKFEQTQNKISNQSHIKESF
jgi:hypothetical protein